jgi:hypothetical protein
MVELTLTTEGAINNLGLAGAKQLRGGTGELRFVASQNINRTSYATAFGVEMPVEAGLVAVVASIGGAIDEHRHLGSSAAWQQAAGYDPATGTYVSQRGRTRPTIDEPWSDFADSFAWVVIVTNGKADELFKAGLHQPGGARINFIKNLRND